MKIIKEILDSKGYQIHSVAPTSTVYEALQKMAQEGIGALIVLDGEELAGIVSERDYAKHVRHLVVRDNHKITGVISIGDVVKAIIDDQQFTIEQLNHYISGHG